MTSSWMLVAGLLFAAAGVFVKLGATDFTAAELTFYRSLFTVVLAAGLVLGTPGGTVRTPHFGAHLLRGIMGAMSLLGFYYAITKLPLTAQTLNYTSPLFLAIATTVVLGERFSGWLVFAIALGFGGVAMLLQPTFAAGQEGPALVGLLSGVFAAWAYLSVRTLGRLGEPDWRVVFWFGAVGTVLCLAWQALTGPFHAITGANWWILAGVGLTGTLAQLAMTRAYRLGNTLVASALSYSTIVFATIFTYAVWGDTLSPLAWAGMVVIVASGLVAMRVEKKEQVEEAGFES
jgi:drug/metabolite transporter (DMT)-like permease